MDSSPHLESRSSRTASPQIREEDREDTIIIGTSADDEDMRYSPIRKAPPNTATKDSFDSYSTRPPPSSSTETTPLTGIEKHDTLPVLHEYTPAKPHAQTMLTPGTPPKSAQRSRNATTTAGPSPTRALSLPMTPTHRADLTETNEDGTAMSHKITSAMAKRSTANGSPRKVVPLHSSKSPSTSKYKAGKRAIRHEEEYGADGEAVASNESSQANPLGATQSLPDLRESRFPIISFLPNLIENQKKTVKAPLPPVVEVSPGRSTVGTETSSSSLSSQKFEYYARYAQKKETTIFRPLTQKPTGENPPGITVHSQSQSDHDYSHSSGDYHAPDHRDFSGIIERKGTTLVAGTPSETSESSQPERDLDMSQLYREGRSFMPDATQEELIPTQIIAGSQDMETLALDAEYAVTQEVQEHGQNLQFPILGIKRVAELATVKTVDVSPRKSKPKGFYSSSSGTSQSIPGLSNPDNEEAFGRVVRTKSTSPSKGSSEHSSKTVPIAVYRPVSNSPKAFQSNTPTRTGRPTALRAAPPPNVNIPQPVAPINLPRPFTGPPTSDKPPKAPIGNLKRSTGLMRRKSPAPVVDQWLAEREAQMRAEADAAALVPQEEETVPVDHAEPHVTRENEETESLGFYSRLNPYGDGRIVGIPHDKTLIEADNQVRSDDETSVVMDTDEEPHEETQSKAPVLAKSHWRASPEGEPATDRTPRPNANGTKVKAFLISGLTRDRSESFDEPIPGRETSTGGKGSNTTTVAVNTPVEWRNDDEDEESSSGADDDASDYNPQATQAQTQDDIFEEVVVEGVEDDEEDEEQALFRPTASRSSKKTKRGARSQGGRDSKRVCRRTESPDVLPVKPAPKTSLKSQRTAAAPPTKNSLRKLELPMLDTNVIASSVEAPPTRSTRAAQNRARTGSKVVTSPRIGHLVLVRYAEAKRFFLGYAVVRTGKLWEITPSDGEPTVYSEVKNMREGVFREGDLVTVSADSGGENCGDAIVIAIDEHWDESRSVKVRIGGKEEDMEERYVSIRHLAVEERHIKQWSDRKVTHKDLEREDAMETMFAPTSAVLKRRESFAIATPGRAFTSSAIRTPQSTSGKIFSGIGFVLTNCDDATVKRITACGGYIYGSWLNAFKFDGALEHINGPKGQQRWIRRLAGIGQGKVKGRVAETSPATWVGNEDEQRVRTMFLVAGKVIMSAKTLISLALGIPCVSAKWIETCELEGKRVDWIPYLLPSHNVPSPLALIPGTLPSQAPDYQWSSEALWESTVLENILAHEPLAHRRILLGKPRILYIAPECIKKLALDYDKHVETAPCQVPFVYSCLAMGAQHVEAVEHYSHATDKTLSKYDLVIIADTLMESFERKDKVYKDLNKTLSTAEGNGTQIINQSDFKMSVACGTILRIPQA